MYMKNLGVTEASFARRSDDVFSRNGRAVVGKLHVHNKSPHDEPSHNLQIQNYSFDEILGLFDLTYDISAEDLKRAKWKVLQLHPDKSRLSSDYFLFFKKAFDIVYNFYENSHRQEKAVPQEKMEYKAVKSNELNSAANKHITSVIEKMKPDEFQSKFNELFEKNMSNTQPKKDNSWFTSEDAVYKTEGVVTKSNMNDVLNHMKSQQSGLVKYNGVQQMFSSGGTSFYDDDDGGGYVTSDPFSKLKFDDLRKVHKDETIFSVSERDFHKVPQYASVEQFSRERGKQDMTPLEKTAAEKMLLEQERIMKERMMNKQYQSQLKTQEYEQKNKAVLSSFLQITR
jgi:hypothetical protein